MMRWAALVSVSLGVCIQAPAEAQDAAILKLLRAGDEAWAEREQDGRAWKAIEYYKKAMVLDDTCTEAYWKAARAHSWPAWHEEDSTKAAQIYLDGAEYAKRGVATDGNSLYSRYWLFIMYGLYGDARGVLQSLHMIDPMMKELEFLLAKDETFEAAGPHRFMGWVLLRIPRFKGGDTEKARKHLERAVELAPKCMLNHFYLAHVYEAQGKREDAKKTLRTMLEQPDDLGWSPENKQQRTLARLMLAKLEKE